MLLTLDSAAKIRTKDDIDKFVSAELPNKTLNPRLYDIITKCMIHGPCGILNPNSPCMKEGLCSKNFPKDFQETTQENVNGYPVYQRSITEPIKVGKYDIDNRWVVPYNPWLSKKFNAHINVEICASVKSVKYLYKYVYKGHDAASIKLQLNDDVNHDEILTFLDGRYVSAPEAMWRLNEFHMSEKSHTVMRLAVHLPNQQQVIYQSGHEVEAVARASARHTTLTAWFQLNQTDVDACRYYYSDMPHYYVFDRSNNRWKRRQRGGDQIIGRMPVVSIQDSKRYFLRMLLLRKPGAISFEDLKAVNGNVCISFQQAYRELDFLEGDEHWHDTLQEASLIRMPHHFRMFFAVICEFGEVEDIPALWTQHRDLLCEDFAHQHSEDTAYQYALAEINDLLLVYGLNLKKVTRG
ncbi:uncharacterized protein [Parasteatoda tepidariorum]|uniref:uncharacterized protein n=1 Tax=Parasteatoda tepidariorum TaxID=114398 RepID=UPI001C71970A|nr:uncharacterized protein LOC122270766 [Parasteatoda tepidariorum]